MMLGDDDAGDDAFGVHADEDLDGTVVSALERLDLGRPERQAGIRSARDSRDSLECGGSGTFGENLAAGNSCFSCPCNFGSTAAAD